MGKYFLQTVKPYIKASTQHDGNITTGEIMADWTEFDIPKGPNKLISVTVLVRGKDGADLSASDIGDFYALWAKGNADGSAPSTLGGAGDGVDLFGWANNIQGATFIDTGATQNGGELLCMNVCMPAPRGISPPSTTSGEGLGGFLLQGEPDSGTNVGYDKMYCALIAKSTLNWESGMTVDGTPATTQKNLDVADVGALRVFAPGDVLHDEDDRLMGTVDTVTDDNNVLMVDNLSNEGVNDKKLYNINPITLICSFEQ